MHDAADLVFFNYLHQPHEVADILLNDVHFVLNIGILAGVGIKSYATTSCPFATRPSAKFEPMKPVPPVIMIFMIYMLFMFSTIVYFE